MSEPVVRPIVCLPDARLRRPARTVRLPSRGVDRLVEELFVTMRSSRGLGLAAPQIGRDARVAVIEVEGSRFVLANPEIIDARGVQLGWEGCLSVPHLVAQVERPADVTVVGVDLAGHPVRYRGSGLVARAIAHEVDHLAGRLYVDLVEPGELIDTREHPEPPTNHKQSITGEAIEASTR